jgi:membrane protease YdiL (CAAX protease family)
MPETPTIVSLVVGLSIYALLGAMLTAWIWAIVRLARGLPLLPARPLRPVPWTGQDALAVFLIYLGFQFLGPPLLLAISGGGRPSFPIGPAKTIVISTVVNGVFLLVAWKYLAKRSGATVADLGLEPGRARREVVRGIVGGVLITPVGLGMNLLAQKLWEPTGHVIEQWISKSSPPSTWALAAFMAVLVAPVLEEFLFRGVLLGALNRLAAGTGKGRPGTGVDPEFAGDIHDPGTVASVPAATNSSAITVKLFLANAVVSLLFAAMHVTFWPTPIPLFFVSLGLGLVYQRTGSLIAPITMHACLNGVSTLLLLLSLLPGVRGPSTPDPGRPVETLPGLSAAVEDARR